MWEEGKNNEIPSTKGAVYINLWRKPYGNGIPYKYKIVALKERHGKHHPIYVAPLVLYFGMT